MEMTLSSSRRVARRALLLVLGAAIVAWLLYVAGLYVDALNAGVAAPYTTLESATPQFSRYLMFAAAAALGLGALFTLRRMKALRGRGTESSLVRPVQRFAAAALIVAASISAVTCMLLFFDGFLGGASTTAALTQTVNLYLPIVLHTALVVTLILAGFVFAARSDGTAAPHVHASPQLAAQPSDQAQRAVALGFAVPLITTSAALIAGLIAADLTGSATQVWLWTIVLAVIGVGIVAGTHKSQQAFTQHAASTPTQPRGAALGAKNLNFVLSIVFVISSVLLALGYGGSAVNALTSSPWLSVDVHESGPGESTEKDVIAWSATGGDLKPGSEITVTLQPAQIELGAASVSRDGWGDVTGTLPAEDAPGEYAVEAHALSKDGRPLTASMSFTRDAQGAFSNDVNGVNDDAYANLPAQMLPITAHRLFSNLLPAGLLLVIAAAVAGLTITARAREFGPELGAEPEPAPAPAPAPTSPLG